MSLTNVGRAGAEKFVEGFDVPWPCGYGARSEELASFWVCTADQMSPTFNPGCMIPPTIYLIGPDGRVLWHDGESRPRHLRDAKSVIQDLKFEIGQHLAQ